MNINQLNRDCILHILSKLSLQESIPVRLVCPYWKYLIEHYHYRPLKSLKLFGNWACVERYSQLVIKHDFNCNSNFVLNRRNHLVLSSIPANYPISSTLLTELFPNVQCLVYFNYGDISLSISSIDLNHLLEKWSTTVEALIMDRISSLLRPIALPALKYFYNFDSPYDYIDEFVAGVSPQLEHLFLNIELELIIIWRTKQWHFFNGKMLNLQTLKQLKLKVNAVDDFVNNVLNQISLNSITHFELDHNENGMSIEDATKAINVIRNNFPNLEYIRTMLFRGLSIDQIVAQLVQFRNLKGFSIDMERNSSQWLRLSNLDLPQLKSIQKLHLTYQYPLIRLNRLAASIQHLFPNLKLLSIDCGCHAEAQRRFDQSFGGCLFKYKLVKYHENGRLDLYNILK